MPDPETAYGFLAERCTEDLRNGGRGLGNMLKSWLINPLSRALWDKTTQPGDRYEIARIRASAPDSGHSRPVIDLEPRP